jgi:hypothetical protein
MEAAEQPISKEVKGPALGSSTHTLRLLVLLAIDSLLVFLCLFVLPAHLLWRKAYNAYSLDTDPSSNQIHEAVIKSISESRSATRNMIVAFRLIFSALGSDQSAVKWIGKGMRSTFAAVVLSRSWFVARFKGWWDEAEAMERGDREEVMKRRRVSMGKQMEDVTMTTFAMPGVVLILYIAVLLCGSPIIRQPVESLFLAAYISVLALLPAVHVLGTDQHAWVRAFSWSSGIQQASEVTPRFKVLIRSTGCTLIGALIGSLGLLLDWDRAFQIYPLPPVLGAALGLIVGNGLAARAYFFSAPSRQGPRVERKAANSTASKKKKRK